jgi:predicted LPLAT superfamily acyltransferase
MGGRLGHHIWFFIVKIIGRRIAGFFLIFVTLFYYVFIPRARRSGAAYLARRFPEQGWLRRCLTAHRYVWEFANVLLDGVFLRLRGAASFRVDFPDSARVGEALAPGRGVIVLSAHTGSWEVVSRFFGRWGVKASVVMLAAEREEITSLYLARSREGAMPFETIISNDPIEALLAVLDRLRRNEVVVMHGDRTTSRALQWPFLGQSAHFPDFPWRVAAATGAPVVSAFCARIGHVHYKATARPYVIVDNSEDGIVRGLASYVAALEDFVTQYPFQWFNFYDFWDSHEVKRR